MAFKVVDSLSGKISYRFGVSTASQAYTAEELLMETSNALVPATSSSTTHNILGIGVKTYTEGGTNATIKYIPIDVVMVIADCTNTTAANQLHLNLPLTDHLNVNNSSSGSSANTALFHSIALSGTTRLYGEINRLKGYN